MPTGEVLPKRLLIVTQKGLFDFLFEHNTCHLSADAWTPWSSCSELKPHQPKPQQLFSNQSLVREGMFHALLATSLVFKTSANGLSSTALPSLTSASRNNILLIVDEVQTGFGRTGEMFASDWLDNGAIKPDILIMAKGIANGFPLSAIATRSEISAPQPPGHSLCHPLVFLPSSLCRKHGRDIRRQLCELCSCIGCVGCPARGNDSGQRQEI